MNNAKYNILVIGRTGVGKSCFVNYLYGDNIVQHGIGKPVTERGFHQVEFALNGLPAVLYDSWGLEADKHQEWMDKFQHELELHGIEQPATEWFHSVFYVVNAAGHRIEDADIAIIRHLQQAHHCITVILTKCDLVSENEAAQLQQAINAELPNVQVISVSSGGEGRHGKTEAFGKEDVQQRALADFFSSMMLRLPAHARARIDDWKGDWRDQAQRHINSVGYMDEHDVARRLQNLTKSEFNDFVNTLTAEMENAIAAYKPVIGAFSESMAPHVRNHVDIDFDMSKDNHMEWWMYPLLPVAVVPAIVYGLITGKEHSRQDLWREFSKNEDRVDAYFAEWIERLQDNLDAVAVAKTGVSVREDPQAIRDSEDPESDSDTECGVGSYAVL